MTSLEKLFLVKTAKKKPKKEVDLVETVTNPEKIKTLPSDIAEEWKQADPQTRIKLLAKYGLLGTALVVPGGIPATIGYVGAKKGIEKLNS